MSIRTLIVDDEPLARRGLELRLAAHADVSVVAQAGNGREALAAVLAHRPDLMLLDVQMPQIDGFGVLRMLPLAQLPLVVFVTAYERFALDAFAANAVDYLLKPVEDELLARALGRVRERMALRGAGQQRDSLLRLLAEVSGRPQLRLEDALAGAAGEEPGAADRIVLRDGNRRIRLEPREILWIDAAGDYMCVHTPNETHVLRGTMRELEQRLDPRRFQRIHRSTMVNLAHVRELRAQQNGDYQLTLDTGQTLRLSRNYKDKLQHLR